MEIKRIKEKSTHDAIRKVREELGPDAVILSTEKTSHGVEIIAALDFDASVLEKRFSGPDKYESELNTKEIEESIALATEKAVNEKISELKPMADLQKQISMLNESIVNMQINVNQDRNKLYESLSKKIDSFYKALEHKNLAQQKDRTESFKVLQDQISQLREEFSDYINSMHPSEMNSIMQIHDEIGDLKDVLGCQTKLLDWAKWAKSNPRGISLVTRLVNAGFGVDLSKKLVSSIGDVESKDTAWNKSLELMISGLKTTQWDCLNNKGVVMALGRTGVGKTTTLAKLATKYVIENGPDNIAFINLDDQRVGGFDQLETYGKILNIPVYRFDNTKEGLENMITILLKKSLVLVDTAGMNEPNSNIHNFIQRTQEANIEVQKLLLMSANTQLHNLKEIVESYQKCKPAGCVITKTDESSQLGNVLTVAIEHMMPVWFETNGQRIPEDIQPIEPELLIKRAIENGNKVGVNESAEEFIFEGLNQYATTD
jgi:flagellar biosynthesis protein FlhF